MEESITVLNPETEKNITESKPVNLLDLSADEPQNVNDLSNILRSSTANSILDNSSANIIDILQGVSMIEEPKATSAIIPRQVN